MILYLATQNNVNMIDFLNDYSNGESTIIRKMIGTFEFQNFATRNMADYSHFEEVILDRSALNDNDETLVITIEQFLTMYSSRVTVIYNGLEESSPFFRKLLDIGVGNIIVSSNLVEIQKDIMSCLSAKGLEKYEAKERAIPKPKGEYYKFNCEHVKVGVIGTQNRIGVTTMAVGLVNWLGKVGASACYVETNKNSILKLLAKEYQAEVLADGFVADKLKFTNSIPSETYNFVIYDIGQMFETKMNVIEQMDIVVCLCGGKMYELPFTIRGLETLADTSAYIFPTFFTEDMMFNLKNLFTNELHEILEPVYQPSFMDTEPNKANYKKMIKEYIATE